MKHLIALALVACIATNALADDKPEAKKKRGQNNGGGQMATMIGKKLGEIELTTEQKAKWETAKSSFEASMKELQEAGLKPELMKQRLAAQKEAREAGLKGKEMATKVNANFSEEQQALFAKQQKAVKAMKTAVMKMLTPEQIEALPEATRKQLTVAQRGKGNGKGKGKKKEDK